MIDAKAFGVELADIVKAATAPLLARIDALEKQIAALPDIPALVDLSIAEAVSQMPKPQDGKDGADGASVTAKDVLPALEEQVRAFLAALPVPKDGRDGIDGKDGAPGERGEKGEPGADGVGLAGALIDRDGALVVTLTNGEAKSLGPVVGKDGVAGSDGRDGADGLGFDDLTFVWREGKAYARFERGEIVKEAPIPGLYDAGAYRDGTEYGAGEGVTYGGSFWIAQRDTSAKPGAGDDWRLAVKKGRDGKDAVVKDAAPKGGA